MNDNFLLRFSFFFFLITITLHFITMKTKLSQQLASYNTKKTYAWNAQGTNANAYYFKNLDAGEIGECGSWSQERTKQLIEALKISQENFPGWGVLSLSIPGRTGHQCQEKAKQLSKKGILKEYNISIPCQSNLKKSKKFLFERPRNQLTIDDFFKH